MQNKALKNLNSLLFVAKRVKEFMPDVCLEPEGLQIRSLRNMIWRLVEYAERVNREEVKATRMLRIRERQMRQMEKQIQNLRYYYLEVCECGKILKEPRK